MKVVLKRAGVPDPSGTVYTPEALKKVKETLDKRGGIDMFDRPGGTKFIGRAVSFEMSKDGNVLYANLEMNQEGAAAIGMSVKGGIVENISDIIERLCAVRPMSIDAVFKIFDKEPESKIKEIVSKMLQAGRVTLNIEWKLQVKK